MEDSRNVHQDVSVIIGVIVIGAYEIEVIVCQRDSTNEVVVWMKGVPEKIIGMTNVSLH